MIRKTDSIEIQMLHPWDSEWKGVGMYYPSETRKKFTKKDKKWIKEELKWYRSLNSYTKYRLVFFKKGQVI